MVMVGEILSGGQTGVDRAALDAVLELVSKRKYEPTLRDGKMNLLILFVVSAATLGLEVLLTRVFSVVLFAGHSF
jgi:hypothetical protein